MVHSVHTNGWADGTRLASGARGWLPTNYCDAYDVEAMRPLLAALRQVRDLLRDDVYRADGRLESDDGSVRGLIQGVRALLV